FWPILGRIVELKSTPLIIGLFSGEQKPGDIEENLQDFVTEIQEMQHNGMTLNLSEDVSVKVQLFICDAPAR
ncbi:hypothetical protein LOTGIDRAFT_99349, partial [Lottia gigantea]